MTEDVKLPPYIYGREAGQNEKVWTAEQVMAVVLAERRKADGYREVLETIAAQSSGVPGSTSRADCMAALAAAAIRRGD